MKKRFFSLVIATVMVATLFVGCGKENNSKNENVTPTKTEETEKVEEPTTVISGTIGNDGEVSENVVDINEKKVEMHDIEMLDKGENGEYVKTGNTYGRYYIEDNILYVEEEGLIERICYSVKLPQYTALNVFYSNDFSVVEIVTYVESIENQYMTILSGPHNIEYAEKLSNITQDEVKQALPSNETFVYTDNDNIETLIYDYHTKYTYTNEIRKRDNNDNYYSFTVFTDEDMFDKAEVYDIAENITIIKDKEILKNFK